MSDSRHLHAHILSLLQPHLTNDDFRNLDTLAWAITGVLLQKTTHMADWINCLPFTTEAASRERCFQRLFSNIAVDARRFYQPFIIQALRDWQHRTLYVAIDTTSIADRLVIARLALLYRGRAVPLAWQVFQRRSVMLKFSQYAGLIKYTAQLLPAGATIVLLGDRGFGNISLMELLTQLKWHFCLRLMGDEYAGTSQSSLSRLDNRPLTPHHPLYLQKVLFTKASYGPINVAMVWDGDPQHDPWRIGTDQRARQQTFVDYALRMGIDFGFLDDKSGGFQLQDAQLWIPERFNRLLLVTALCNLYLISAGTQVVVQGQRLLVDPHPQRRLSYLQLGWRWLDYSLACDTPLPERFYLDPQPDPEPVSQLSLEQFTALSATSSASSIYMPTE